MANKRLEVDQGLKIGSFTIDETTGDITTTGNLTLTNGQLIFSNNQAWAITQGGTGATTQQAAITALTGTQTSGYYLRSNGTNASLSALSAADLTGTVSIVKGGTGQTSQQAAINALVGTQTNAHYLRSDGTNVTMSALAAGDLTGTVPITAGGTGQTTASAAINALMPSQTNNTGKYLTTDGTNLSWSTVAGGGLPSVSGNAGKYLTTDGTNVSWGTIAAGNLPSMDGNSGKILTTDGTSASWANITGGADTSVTSSNGTITVSSTATLDSVLSRGATSNTAVNLGNTTQSSSSSTGALTVAGGVGIGKDLTVGGNLTVLGSLTTLQTANLEIDDLNITLARGAVNAEAANGAGLTVDGAGATITYNSFSDSWDFNKDIATTGNLTVGDLTVSGTISVQPGILAGETPTMTYNSITDTWDFNKDLVANTFVGNVNGNVTGDVTGNVSGTASNVTGVVAIINGGTGATDTANARINLGLSAVAASGNYSDLSGTPVLANVATSGSYNDLTNKPSLFSGSYTDLSNKPALANVATSGSYSDLSGTPVLANVATSGSYNDLSNKPTLANVATSGSYTDLTNKPSLFSGSYTDLSNKPTSISGYGITDAYTKTEVDSLVTGLDMKQSVRAATTVNITLSGTQTIDGVSVIAGDRVLVKNQTTASQNGIYVVAAGAWARAVDADNTPGSEVTSGMYTFVQEGTVNADSGWVLVTEDTIVLGTTALTFTQFNGLGQITAGAGLTKTGNQIDIGGTADRITVNADSIDIASTYVGQSSITTLGNVTTGTWNGDIISVARGGTGTTTSTGSGSVVLSESPTIANLTYTGTLTGSTGVINIGSGQIYKDTSGRLLIGATAARTSYLVTPPLQTEALSAGASGASFTLNSANSEGANVFFTKTRGTSAGSNTTVVTGDTLGNLYWAAADGTNTQSVAARISAAVEGTVGTASTPGVLRFATTAAGGSFPSERMRIDSTGNVGIGIASPGARLDVTSSAAFMARFSGPANSYVDVTDGTGTFRAQLLSNTPFLTSIGAYGLILGTNNTERIRIDSSGNVGIGTSSPTAKLDVYVGNGVIRNSIGSTSFGIQAVETPTAANQRLGLFGFGSDTDTFKARVSGFAEAAWTAGVSTPSYLAFHTTANSSVTAAERMRIDSNGYVGIGTTTPGARLQVAMAQGPTAITSWTDTGGANNSYLSLYNNSSAWVYATSKNGTGTIRPIRFAMNDWGNATTDVSLSLETNGTVGIGTTSPTNRLTVADSGSTPVAVLRTVNTASAATYVALQGYNSSNVAVTYGQIGSTIESNTASSHNGALVFATASAAALSERMRIDSSGNVGVGTTSPQGNLQVTGTGGVRITGGAGQNSYLFVGGINTSDQRLVITDVNNTENRLWGRNNVPITIYTNDVECMRINANGNLGIGTISPVAKLDIQGSTNVAAVLNQRTDVTSLSTSLMFKTAGFNYWAMRQSSGALTWYQDTAVGGTTTEYMRLTAGGNLGLGITPQNASSTIKTLEMPAGALSSYSTTSHYLMQGLYTNSSSQFVNKGTTASTAFLQSAGKFYWQTATAGTADALANSTGNLTDRMILDNTGNLGIGTTAPSTLLHIVSGDPIVTIENSASTSNARINLKNTGRTWSVAVRGADLSDSFAIRDVTASADRLVITSAGNVGIGTTAPGYKLDIGGAAAGTATISCFGPSADNNWAGGIRFASSNGTTVTSQIMASTLGVLFDYGGTTRMQIDTTGNLIVGNTNTTIRASNASGTNIAGANLTIAAGNGTGTGGSGYLSFQTANTGSTGSTANTMTERLRIDNGGNIIMGGLWTGSTGNDGPITYWPMGGTLQRSGTLRAYVPAGAAGVDYVGLRFTTNNGTTNTVNAMHITPAGDVGIGTATPAGKLEVNGNISGSSSWMHIRGSSIAWPTSIIGQTAGRICLTQSSGNSCLILHDDTAVAAGTGPNGVYFTGRTNDTGPAYQPLGQITALKANATQGDSTAYMVFKVGGAQTERMRIDANGHVAIGTTSTNLSSSSTAFTVNTATAASFAALEIASAGTLRFYINANSSASYISSQSTNPMVFQTNGAERMRLDSAGKLLVNRTTGISASGVTSDHSFKGTTGNGNWAVGIENAGNTTPWGMTISYSGAAPNNTTQDFLWCLDTGGQRMSIRSNGGIANYQANNVNLSDSRLKKDVELAGSYLEKICAIPVKTFLYNDQTDNERNLGVMAQDVEAVAPELVDTSGFGKAPEGEAPYKAIYQTDLQYALMKCIQEQQEMILSLQKRIEQLEAAKKQ